MKRQCNHFLSTIFLFLFLFNFNVFGHDSDHGKMTYTSKNIIGFENIFDNAINTQPDQEVFGYLRFPDEINDKYPLIIASHGSLNWGEHHLKYLELMRQAGFAVFAMHPFDSRGTTSTVGDQINLTLETVIWDMAMALKMLWDDPRIDNRKIYAAGWSLGGSAVLFNAWMPFQREAFEKGESFTGYLMWYPGCMALPDVDDWDKDLMQIYMGAADNWTPPKPCIELVSRINKMGGNAKIELYPGAYHTFDGLLPLKLWPDAYSFAECEFWVSGETKTVYAPNKGEFDFSDPQARRRAYETCAIKGKVMAGSSPEYQNAAYVHLATLLKN